MRRCSSCTHLLVALQHCNLTLQQSILPFQLRDLGRGRKCTLYAAALYRILELVELLDPVFELVLKIGVLLGEVPLDSAYPRLEAVHDIFNVFNGQKKCFAEGGQHRSYHFERGNVPVDKAVLVLPVWTTGGGETRPKREKKIITFVEVFLELGLKCLESLAV